MACNSKMVLTLVALLAAPLISMRAAAEDDLSGDWDVVVIGGGLMGSSAAWQLARAGQRVLLLEKQGEDYTQGSSFGEARISRSLGPPGDVWSYMHNRTVAEAEILVDYLVEHGQAATMEDVYTTSPVNYVRNKSRLENYAYLPDQPDHYQLATTPEQAKTQFGLELADDAFIVREFKAHSGTINPAAVIDLTHRATGMAGGRVAYGRQVMRVARAADGFEIDVVEVESGRRETLSVPAVVSAAGPYTGQVLREVAPAFDRLVTPQRVYLAFFEVRPEYWNAMSRAEQIGLHQLFPGINSTVPGRGNGSFSMVERHTPEGTPVLKIGGHFQRSDIEDLDAVWQQALTPDEIEWAQTSLLQHLSLLGAGISAEYLRLDDQYSCVYSLTSSEVPYVTFAPRADGTADPKLVVIAGLSGVGAKGSLGYGAIAADLLLGRSDPDPVYQAAREAFGFERLRRDIDALAR